MIPLGDASRRPLRFPIVTTLLIAVNALVFMLELVGVAYMAHFGSFLFGAVNCRLFESSQRRYQQGLDQ